MPWDVKSKLRARRTLWSSTAVSALFFVLSLRAARATEVSIPLPLLVAPAVLAAASVLALAYIGPFRDYASRPHSLVNEWGRVAFWATAICLMFFALRAIQGF